MIISAIVAQSSNGIIGKNNQVPWYLPSDLKRFKRITEGHTVLMGRKTYESIGKENGLPRRKNIIVTSNKHYKAGKCQVVHSFEDAIKLAEPEDELFVLGGSSVYYQAHKYLSRIYLTTISDHFEGDSFFNFKKEIFNEICQSHHSDNGIDYIFSILKRKEGY